MYPQPPHCTYVGEGAWRAVLSWGLGRPTYLRLRSLDPDRPLAGGYTELTIRRQELADHPPAQIRDFDVNAYVASIPLARTKSRSNA